MLKEESVIHLCSFARMCWDIINIDIPLNAEFPELTVELKAQLRHQFLMEEIILLCWTIWTTRNEIISSMESV